MRKSIFNARAYCIRPILAVALGFALCFAQEPPPKLAVYVSGAEAGVNKSLGGKLLAAMVQSGSYAEIADPAQFQDKAAESGKGDIALVSQTAHSHGADYVCIVSITEALGSHSVSARLIKTPDSQTLKTGSVDRSIKVLDDLTAISNELAKQLLPPGSYAAPPPPAPPEPPAPQESAQGLRKGETGEPAPQGKGGNSFGIRAGINLSHVYAEYSGVSSKKGTYDDIFGLNAGILLDIPITSWLYIQPELMYAQKGLEDKDGTSLTAHYIGLIPLQFSFKISDFRLNAGPYLGICVDSDYNCSVYDLLYYEVGGIGFDIGLSTGIGYDMGMFYFGLFYDYGFTDVSSSSRYKFYNRTLGINLGVNL